MEQTNNNALAVQQAEAPVSMSVFGSVNSFETAQRMAILLSKSSIVPEVYRGEKGLPNCVVALEMANRMQASPLMVMQNLYIVHGNPGWSSKFLISCLNTCGRFSALRYEFKGNDNADDWGCRAYAVEKSTGETLYGSWVTIGMAKAEGWFNKPGSKWKTMPQLMLQYRAAAFFQRAYAPEISMGMQTAEEVADITDYEEVKKPTIVVTEPDEKQASKAADLLGQAFAKGEGDDLPNDENEELNLE